MREFFKVVSLVVGIYFSLCNREVLCVQVRGICSFVSEDVRCFSEVCFCFSSLTFLQGLVEVGEGVEQRLAMLPGKRSP